MTAKNNGIKYQEWYKLNQYNVEAIAQFISWYQDYTSKQIQNFQQDPKNIEFFFQKKIINEELLVLFFQEMEAQPTLQETSPFFSNKNTYSEESWNQFETVLSSPEKEANFFKENDFKTTADSPLVHPPKPKEAVSQTRLSSEREKQGALLSQKKFGKYEVLSKLGEGGMGLVFKVRHLELKTIYALKVMLAGEHASEDAIERFHREARTVAKLKHPGIIQVMDSGQENAFHYFVMEYVEGEPLDQRIKNGLPLREGLLLIQKSLEALHYAHRQNVLHRDLKPANIFVTQEGHPKIGDFGLAKDISLGSESQKLTQSGIVLGTPAYMPPEQAMGDLSQLDERTDVYAMGACLYQMLTNKFVHEAPTLHMMIYKILYEEITRPSFINAQIHRDVETILLKALEKKKEKRYQNALEFAEDIRLFLAGYPIKAKPISTAEKVSKWAKRNKYFLGMSLFAVLFIFLLLGYGYWNFQKTQQEKIQMFLSQAKEETQKAEQLSKEPEKEGPKIQHFLNALKYLDQADSILPRQPEIQKQKIALRERLVPLVCETEDYQLADYLVSTFEAVSETEKTKQQQWFQFIEHAKKRVLKQHQSRLKELIVQFTQTDVGEHFDQNALFEISKMTEEEIFQEVLKIVQEGSTYFLTAKDKSYRLNRYYRTMARALGRLENKRSDPVIRAILEQMSEALSLVAFPSFEDIEFMVDLSESLALIGASELSIFLGNIRRKMGSSSSYWELTLPLYESLIQKEEWFNKIATTATEYYQRSLYYGDKKEYLRALEDCNQAIRIDSKYIEAYLQRGQMQEALGKFKEAFEDYQLVLQQNPNHVKAYNYRGVLHFNQQAYPNAKADFEKVIQLDPRDFKGYHNRGNVKFVTGDLDGAFNDYTQALEYNPQHIMSYLRRAEIRIQKGQYKDAIHLDYDVAKKAHPKNPDIYFNRGVASFYQKNYYQAFMDFQKTLELAPQYLDAHFMSGLSRAKQGEYEGALLDFNQAIQMNPQDIRAYFERGCLKMNHLDKNIQKESIDDFQKVIDLAPQFSEAHFNLATVYYNLGQIEKAIKGLIQALKLQENEETRKRLLILLLSEGQKKISLKEYKLARQYLQLFQKYAPQTHPQQAEVEKLLEQCEKNK